MSNLQNSVAGSRKTGEEAMSNPTAEVEVTAPTEDLEGEVGGEMTTGEMAGGASLVCRVATVQSCTSYDFSRAVVSISHVGL